MSINNIITVRQTVLHTIQLCPHGLGTPCGSRLSRRKAQYSVLCLSQAAALVTLAHMIEKQRGPGEEYMILVKGKINILVTLQLIKYLCTDFQLDQNYR